MTPGPSEQTGGGTQNQTGQVKFPFAPPKGAATPEGPSNVAVNGPVLVGDIPIWNGTEWEPNKIAGSGGSTTLATVTGQWTTITLGAKVEDAALAGVPAPALRVEMAGYLVRLRGVLKVKLGGGTLVAGETIVSGLFLPGGVQFLPTVVNLGTAATMKLSATGVLTCETTLGEANTIPLQGLVYSPV